MIAERSVFNKGLALMVSFVIVFILIFMPLFGKGKNGLEYLDDLYNSISKGSAYYIPKLKEEVEPFVGKTVSMTLEMASIEQAEQTARLMKEGGATTTVSDAVLKVEGDIGQILNNCLADADLMYANHGAQVKNKYGGMDERQALYNWWAASKLMDKDLKKQKLFAEAMVVTSVKKRGVETSYNYYRITPEKITAKWGIVLFSLIFYVVYTIWYGFAIMFLFEGWGLRLEH